MRTKGTEIAKAGQDKGEVKYLTSVPQKLGILPTYGFWFTRTRAWIVCLIGAPVLTSVMVSQVGLSMVPAAIAGYAGTVLGLGLFERYIRRKVRQRNSLQLNPSQETR